MIYSDVYSLVDILIDSYLFGNQFNSEIIKINWEMIMINSEIIKINPEIIMINSEIIKITSKSHENEGKTNKRASTDDKMLFTFLEYFGGWGNSTNGDGDFDYDILKCV